MDEHDRQMMRYITWVCAAYVVIVFGGTYFFSAACAQDLGSATLSWASPDRNTDGTPLTDLEGFKIYYGTEPGNYPNLIAINNPETTTYVVENLLPGTYYFVSTAFNSKGEESEFSNVVSKMIEGNLPGLQVINETVYTLVKQTNRFVLLPVGTVPIGTDCDPMQRVNGLYVVPRSEVQWAGTIQPLVVVADCS